MKYVCKDKFIKVLPLGHGMFSVLEVDIDYLREDMYEPEDEEDDE